MQLENSIQFQSLIPLVFSPNPGWMQAMGQTSTQSAQPSHLSVIIVYAIAIYAPTFAKAFARIFISTGAVSANRKIIITEFTAQTFIYLFDKN